jgi:hypothetical protein
MSTRLASSTRRLLAGRLGLAAAASYPAFGRTPAPGAALALETPLNSAKQQFTIPDLPAATVATVFLVVNKVPAAEDLRMLCAILTAGDSTRTWAGYTGRDYYFNGGVTVNTYRAGFVSMQDATVFDNGRTILLTIKFTKGGAFFYLNGVLQVAVASGDALGDRPWSDQFMVGGEPSGSGFDWQGLISACYLYLSDLGDNDRARTEGYLLAKYPAIT